MTLTIKSVLSKIPQTPHFYHSTPLNGLTKNLAFRTLFKYQSQTLLSLQIPSQLVIKAKNFGFMTLQPHHTPYLQPQQNSLKLVIQAPHPLILSFLSFPHFTQTYTTLQIPSQLVTWSFTFRHSKKLTPTLRQTISCRFVV